MNKKMFGMETPSLGFGQAVKPKRKVKVKPLKNVRTKKVKQIKMPKMKLKV